MKHRSVLSCLFLVAVTAIGVFGLAQDSPTEAPASRVQLGDTDHPRPRPPAWISASSSPFP